jgi:hypothetical protein
MIHTNNSNFLIFGTMNIINCNLEHIHFDIRAKLSCLNIIIKVLNIDKIYLFVFTNGEIH